MTPMQLRLPCGSPVHGWACSSCLRVHRDKDVAGRCCLSCVECGKEKKPGHTLCQECLQRQWSEQRRAQSEQWLEEAEEVEEPTGMLYSELAPGGRDGYYDDLDDVADAIYWAIKDGETIEQPVFVHTCEHHVKGLDLDQAIECMLDDTYEDVDWPSKTEVDKLMKHVDAFNEKCAVHYFTPDYSKKVRVPLVEV